MYIHDMYSMFVGIYVVLYSGSSLLRTLWDFKFSPYYRCFLNSEVIRYTTILHRDIEWCPYYRGSTFQRFVTEKFHRNT